MNWDIQLFKLNFDDREVDGRCQSSFGWLAVNG